MSYPIRLERAIEPFHTVAASGSFGYSGALTSAISIVVSFESTRGGSVDLCGYFWRRNEARKDSCLKALSSEK